MTDITASTGIRKYDWSSVDNIKRVRKRYRADWLLQAFGIAAIATAVILLGILILSLIVNGSSAFVTTKANLEFYLDAKEIDRNNPNNSNFRKLVNDAFAKYFPEVTSPNEKRELAKILSSEVRFTLRDYVVANPDKIGQTVAITVPLSDPFDQLYKGIIPARLNALSDPEKKRFDQSLRNRGLVTLIDGKSYAKVNLFIDPAKVKADAIPEGDFKAIVIEGINSLFLERVSSVYAIFDESSADIVKAYVVANPDSIGKMLEGFALPLSPFYDAYNRGETPKIPNPRIGGEKQIEWFERLQNSGLLVSTFSWELFLNADSRFPEQAGLAGAIIGSFFALLVCFLVSFPVGIAAAVYLEEFAPKNKFTDLIEVNINNLAAVPSVVFGLLGLAVFLGWFGLPRSAPLVGGLVLALMTLPTIIIATRAALKAVPPSIREAALGVGASKHQVIMHHVLPLAMPGILTGTIIGLAQALGETAPLLLIGMNAFITSASTSILEPATALPTQIYSWADSPERGFVARTSAAILVLLGFLVIMNSIAIYLRQRFEKKW